MEISGMGPMAINYQKMVEQMLEDRDTNGDGALSIEEISMPDEAFAKIDINEDGLADKDELKAFFPMAQFDRIATEILVEKDENGDGVLTPNEINMPHEAFEKADEGLTPPINTMPANNYIDDIMKDAPVGGEIFKSLNKVKKMLSLPIHPFLNKQDIRYISQKIIEFYEK